MSAEEEAGNSERALLRLTELSDHVYRAAIESARKHVELAALAWYTPYELRRSRAEQAKRAPHLQAEAARAARGMGGAGTSCGQLR